jgi:arsenate reductase-like glutaredoxin family protein
VIAAIPGGMEALVNPKSPDYHLFMYLTEENRRDKLLESPVLLNTPIVRNGKLATVGYSPEVWKQWNT